MTRTAVKGPTMMHRLCTLPGLVSVTLLAAICHAPLVGDDQKEVVIEKPKTGEKSPSDKPKDEKPGDDKEKDKEEKAKEDKPAGKTHTVTRGPFKQEISLEASIAGATAHEIAVDPDSFIQLSLRQVVPH